MKGTVRKLLFLIFFCILLTAPVSAKNMGSMIGMRVTWNLKPNKSVTYYTYVGGAKFLKQKMKLTNISAQKDPADSSYAYLRFTIEYDKTLSISAYKLNKIITYYSLHPNHPLAFRCYVTVVDYDSGLCLLNSNNKGVTVSLQWKNGQSQTYKYGNDKFTIMDTSVNVTIRYPIAYKGMCIGAGGWSTISPAANDDKFWSGLVPFWQANGKYSKYAKVAHFIRYAYE
ncbi:MAG: hypothetical protein IIZ39_06260 [Blautia sp.]|nr:hypothetical protein [Blautia sp.]